MFNPFSGKIKALNKLVDFFVHVFIALRVWLAELPETGITQTESITVTVSVTGGIGVSVTGIGQTSVEHGGVVDQRGGGGDDTGGTGKDSGLGVSITSLSLGGGLGEQGEVGGLGLSDLGGVLGSDGELGVEDGSDEGLGVEGGGNQGLRVEGGSNGKSRVLNTESESYKIRAIIFMLFVDMDFGD